LAGASHAQLEGLVRELRGRFGLDVDARLPPVTFVERPLAPVLAHGLHRRLKDGEVAEFGEVWLEVEPGPPEHGWRFVGQVDEDDLPERFLPAVGEGAHRALRHGPTAGYPVAGVVVRCTGGEYDALESTEQHFETAGELAVRRALEEAGTELLEPWHEVEVHVPGADVGSVLADLAAHRSRVVGLEVIEGDTVVQVHVPESELRTLGRRLEGLTRGRGWFSARTSHYDRVPVHLVGEAVASSPFRRARSPVEAK
jgi:elongation factor G